MATDRRVFIKNMLIGAGILYVFPQESFANSKCDIEHPFMPPKSQLKGECHNCGMMRPMWARTWHSYERDGQKLEVCSLHCLAEASLNSGNPPEKVNVALYLKPQTTIPADQAFYVIASKARGTMTMKSKLAFSSRQEAEEFANTCSGTVVGFNDAYQIAMKTIEKENQMISRNRLAKGKIVEPQDNKDKCPVCSMYPARYPKNKCQLQTADGQVVHFCSTYCLFMFLKNPQNYGNPGLKTKFIWVIDYEDGQWIHGRNAYYVIGTTVKGPMGKEAFPYVNLEKAKKFSTTHSGKILRFNDVTIDQIMI